MEKLNTVESVSDALRWLYAQSLDQSSLRFRGHADADWTLLPSIHRYRGLDRYQTVRYEHELLTAKPSPSPPLTHTSFDLEWLMVCQHYGVPTRLLDWTADVLIALFFACEGDKDADRDGALFVCDMADYEKFSAYDQSAMETQNLVFVGTNVVNPRMRAQAGCFMMWGHAPLEGGDKGSYDLWQFHEQRERESILEKIVIPSKAKSKILNDLSHIYGMSGETIYLRGGFFDTKYGVGFERLEKVAWLKTLYTMDADRLSEDEAREARKCFNVECRNMLHGCVSLSMIK